MPDNEERATGGPSDELIDEIATYYGDILPAADEYRLLARHVPEFVEGYLRMRRALFAEGGAALDPKVRELVTVAILVALKKTNPPPISHTRKALEHGATPAELAEVLALCILLGGMVTYRESGRFVLREADKSVG
jgi:alkylhydroperoxidase/carboxymuconolactone decarboxylase family protein YurZ